MKIIKNIFAQLHRFVFWAIILSLFWCWIYTTFVGNTSREKKIVVCINAYAMDRRSLALRLEGEQLPAGIKMIQVHSFDYDIFGGTLEGDIYIMKGSILRATLEETPDRLAAVTPPEGREGYDWQGSCYGILVFDAATQQGPAMDCIRYAHHDSPEPESYYLCFDAASPHLASQPGAVDNAAWEAAMRFLALEGEAP